MAPWGLCKDEFTDTGHWPHQLYVREARRMVGEFVVSQKDIQTDLLKPDVIGMGSYNSDSHNIQRIVNAEGFAENEGDMQVSVTPVPDPVPGDAAQARARRPTCSCRSPSRPRTWPTRRCAWSRST